jgi:hypothetical protein
MAIQDVFFGAQFFNKDITLWPVKDIKNNGLRKDIFCAA